MADAPTPPPPASRRGDEVDVLHGVEVPDPYRWLEDGSSPDVTEWVAAHNRRTREALDARPIRGRWRERLAALTGLPTTMSLAVAGDRLFTLERPTGADQYVLVVRSAADPTVPARTLLDPAAGAVDGAVAIDWFHPSHDGSLVAVGLSEGGTEHSVLHLVRTADAEVLPLRIPNTRAASVAWRPDLTGFWYAVYPEGDEYRRHIRYHDLTRPYADPIDDPVVFDRLPTPEAWPDVSMGSDGRYLLVHVMVRWTQVDVHLLDTVSGARTSLVEGVDAQSSFRVVDGRLVGVTTNGAPNGRLVTASLDDPSAWTDLVPERADAVLGSFVPCGDEMLLVVSAVGVDRIERWPSGDVLDLGVASVVALDADDGRAFIARGTFGAPVGVIGWSPGAEPRPWGEVVGEVAELMVRQVHYPSLDGTLVPMFVAHRRDVVPGPDTPTILTGYGGFAIAESPVWMPNLAAWCAEGGLYCIAGLRGGYEYGETWHHAGRRANKQRVFDDFHAAADWLVVEGFTRRERLAVHGGSNGGLLMGAAITQRPDLAAAVWCAVPLLDMIRFPQFLIARLWTDEYGDPDTAEEFGWLHAYSPYHRVSAGVDYPPTLFTTAEGDTRVDPCHARKMTAALVEVVGARPERPVLLTQAGRAGHGAGKPAAMRIDEGADVLTFFSWQLGLDTAG